MSGEERTAEQMEDDIRRLRSHMEHYPDSPVDTGCAAALERIEADLWHFIQALHGG